MQIRLKMFMATWFPKTEQWNNVANFILESGVELTDEVNAKWLTGYTNISRCEKPHHLDPYIRTMEENMFVLHDIVHNIFTLDTKCTEDIYVKRQIYGELFTFYLVEYVIPKSWYEEHYQYIDKYRGSYWMMVDVLTEQPDNINIIDWMWKIFIDDNPIHTVNEKELNKYKEMFKKDLVNSRKNYKLLPDIKSYCIVGETSQNHIDFFNVVSSGAIKNIKRSFNLKLPEEWL